jgi:hypothetical protein
MRKHIKKQMIQGKLRSVKEENKGGSALNESFFGL